MTLDKQVCSLELAKTLTELGMKQESYFVWVETPIITPPQWELVRASELQGAYEGQNFYPAFTVAELGGVIPMEPMLPKAYMYSSYRLPKGRWVVEYVNGRKVLGMQLGDTEADARAKMIIYLLEKKLIEPKT